MADHLELVALRVSVAKLNGIQSDPRSEQTGAKMELMGFPRAVSQPDGFEFDVFKIIQTV